MKEFDKWWCKHWDENYEGAMRGDMEESWKAALRMVLLIHDESYDIPDEGIYIGDIIRDKIEQELEGSPE